MKCPTVLIAKQTKFEKNCHNHPLNFPFNNPHKISTENLLHHSLYQNQIFPNLIHWIFIIIQMMPSQFPALFCPNNKQIFFHKSLQSSSNRELCAGPAKNSHRNNIIFNDCFRFNAWLRLFYSSSKIPPDRPPASTLCAVHLTHTWDEILPAEKLIFHFFLSPSLFFSLVWMEKYK